MAEENGSKPFHSWSDGAPPVQSSARVTVIYESGRVRGGVLAGSVDWSMKDGRGAVRAYRVEESKE